MHGLFAFTHQDAPVIESGLEDLCMPPPNIRCVVSVGSHNDAWTFFNQYQIRSVNAHKKTHPQISGWVQQEGTKTKTSATFRKQVGDHQKASGILVQFDSRET
jgi:hypothetical protein